MNAYCPITTTIKCEADWIITALNSRSQKIKDVIDSQSLIKRIIVLALKILALACSVLAAASIPVAAFTFTLLPLTISGISLSFAVACLSIYLVMDPRNAGESIVKDHWKALFIALRKGNGEEIILTCKELAKQKESRSSAFKQCLGSLTPEEIEPFFHKTCLLGHLLMAVQHLRLSENEQAKTNAYKALSHFEPSGFNTELEQLAKTIADSPSDMRDLIETHHVGNDLHALDYLLSLKTSRPIAHL